MTKEGRLSRANIFITGFSGAGKTTVGRRVARILDWRFVDTDEEIVEVSGKPIAVLFEEDGEAVFRRLESERLSGVCEGDGQIVSTGGGLPMDEGNRRLMESNGVIVCLEAAPSTIHRRLFAGPGAETRPMLDAPDPLRRIAALKSKRQPSYALAHWTVHTDHLTPGEAAAEVVRAWRVLTRTPAPAAGRTLLSERAEPVAPGEGPKSADSDGVDEEDLAATVRTSSGDYPVWVGWGTLAGLGGRVLRVLDPPAAYVVTDTGAYRHARSAVASLEAAGVPSHVFVIPPGETSKTLEMARRLYEWMAYHKAERGHLVLAVGGGVVGDLAGYAAATFLRGIPFGQVPTSLLAMMDAAIGGKTGVDLRQGKNLVGAFHQPSFVLEDVQTLETLPARELASGWAEAIKHGLILDEGLLRTFESGREAIVSLDRKASTDVIRRSVAVKAGVVSLDEKETLGVRVLLNYGHTIGHGIEAATGYGRYLHGEAVSIGMMGAAAIGGSLGLLGDSEMERQRAVLEAYGLPVALDDIDLDAVSEAMTLDKKTTAGSIRWVLLDGIGRAVTRGDVSQAVVDDALRGLMA